MCLTSLAYDHEHFRSMQYAFQRSLDHASSSEHAKFHHDPKEKPISLFLCFRHVRRCSLLCNSSTLDGMDRSLLTFHRDDVEQADAFDRLQRGISSAFFLHLMTLLSKSLPVHRQRQICQSSRIQCKHPAIPSLMTMTIAFQDLQKYTPQSNLRNSPAPSK